MCRYDKVFLDFADAIALYREPLHFTQDGRRIVLRTVRLFQEYLGVNRTEEGTILSKGKQVRINLNFPGYVPENEPVLNWFQVALKQDNPMLADPLGCKARYKGVMPGYLHIREILDIPSEFILEDEPRYTDSVNYALFIYDRADYADFLEGVNKLLGGCLNHDRLVVSDSSGNKILVSDETAQPMLLIPCSLLIGGKDHVALTWDSCLKEVRPIG